jgi:heptosyltransferase-1
MTRVLLVKTSSMADVIHNLPITSDIRAAMPDGRIDWVVEEAFADLPRLNPGVSLVLPAAIRAHGAVRFEGRCARKLPSSCAICFRFQ